MLRRFWAVAGLPPNCGTGNSPSIFGGFGGFDGSQCFQPSNASFHSAVSAFLAVLKSTKVLAVSAVLAFLAVRRFWRLNFCGGRAVGDGFLGLVVCAGFSPFLFLW